MFKNVIVRRPGLSISEGITSAPQPGKPDYHNAIKQHDAYIDTLKKCGVSVTVFDAIVTEISVCERFFERPHPPEHTQFHTACRFCKLCCWKII